jgi:uncharacterized protein involved in tellurium resistance
MMFEPNSVYTNNTVAAAVISFPNYKQLSFYVPFGFWSLTSLVLGHVWFAWGTRGFFPGYRRIMFSTHVDDVFLATTVQEGQPDYRATESDMIELERWQANINTRMNAGSNFRLDLCFNGNGVFAAVQKKNATIKQVELDDAAYIDVDKEFVKPPGTGIDVWAPINLNPYSPTSIQNNLAVLKQNDDLFRYIHDNQAKFFLNSHTFTHEDLNNCSYRDAFNEIRVNQNFAKGAGFDTKSYWSKHAIVSPGISGVYNADALQAFVDAGITSVVGDITRTNITNLENIHWPFITTKKSSNFDGFTIIPRAATAIYYNCSTPQENEKLWHAIYPDLKLNFAQILDGEADRALYKLMQLHWDAYMFHQANMKNMIPSENPAPGPTSPLSVYNSQVNVTGTKNGATAKYTGGNLSILGSWAEAVVQKFNQLVSWPMVTYKLDDMEDMFKDRVIRETAGVEVTISANRTGFTTFSITSQKPCVAPISFPRHISTSNVLGLNQTTWKREKRGTDPLTVWVPLDGKSVITMTVNRLVRFY